MDSLGKIFDFLVLLAVLFIFPVNWAFDQAEAVGDYAVNGIVEDFFSKVQDLGGIELKEMSSLRSNMSDLFGYYEIYISVKRGISDVEITGENNVVVSFESLIDMSVIEAEIEENGFFELHKNDVLSLSISDKKGVFMLKVRVIT